MSKENEKIIRETIYSLYVEGFETTDDEKQILIDIAEGRKNYKDVLTKYIQEAYNYAGV